MITREDLIAEVADRTKGTASDPLTRDEVALVIDQTMACLVEKGYEIHPPAQDQEQPAPEQEQEPEQEPPVG